MLIRNGTIIDGTKKERYKADVRIEADKIQEIGSLEVRKGEQVIDAKNQFVTPGFVDIINRSDIHFSIFNPSRLRSLIRQGITTIVGGNCGASLAPLAGSEAIKSIQKWHDPSGVNLNWARTGEFLDEVERHNLSVNFATLTGHATLRRGIVGDSFEKLSDEAMKKMEYLLEQSLEEGAFGFSTGLAYSHEKVASAEEIERFVKVLKQKGGIYTTHLRDEGADLVSSVKEVTTLAKTIEIPCHISHFKALGKAAWSEFQPALEIIEKTKESGALVSFDVYPYTQTSTVLYLLLPDWVTRGGKAELLKRIRDAEARRRVSHELQGKGEEISSIIIARGDLDPTFFGKTIFDIAKKREVSVIEVLLDVIIASNDRVIGFMPVLDARNVELGIKSGAGIVASDGAGYQISNRRDGILVHPRSFGAFPRFLAKYTRKDNILSWEEAIWKITALPAEIVGLKDRGKIAKGYYADMVVFHPDEIQDKATFKDPFQYSQGISHVLVNGGIAFKKEKFQKGRYGRVLRKK